MANQKTDFLDALFGYGIDIRRRRVHLRDMIDEASIQDLIKGLLLLDDQSKQPIEIYLSSEGGDCYEMFAAYDIIRGLESHVTMVLSGKIMSAAVVITCAGDDRKAYPNTKFMVHELAYEIDDAKIVDHEAALKHSVELMDTYYKCIAERTNKSAKQWKQYVKGNPDRYLTAEEALKCGIIDKIIEID